ERMSRLLGGPGLLVVSGVSGAGKSSLLRAGVVPRLRGAGLPGAPGAASWPSVVFTPTRAPLDELALRVAPLSGGGAAAGGGGGGVGGGVGADGVWFAWTGGRAARARPLGQQTYPGGSGGGGDQPRGQGGVLLVVDQFEEVFTQCAEEGQRRAFIPALHAAA